jgi:hypothetical protein
MENYVQLINKLTIDFAEKFCDNGKIDWKKLVKFNSGFEKISIDR